MERHDRIALYEGVLGMMLARGKERAYVTFETIGDSSQYVQFMLRDGAVYAEVGSRQWDEPERPLPKAAVVALENHGFTGGGPERNFARDGLPRSAKRLANLTDALFLSAYALDDGFQPFVKALTLNDVTLPRAEPFTRDLILALVRDRGLHFLRDEDDDVRFDLQCEALGQPVTVWLCVQGDDDAIYHVFSAVPESPRTWSRQEWLERCNDWNRAHRWPKAMVVDTDDGFRVITAADIALNEGVTRALLGDYTDRIIGGTLEFWSWIAAPEEPSSADRGGDGRTDTGS